MNTETDRLRAKGWTDRKVLAAMGHPGYGEAFATKVLNTYRISGPGATLFEIVYAYGGER